MFELVCFDLDDTLFNFKGLEVNAYKEVINYCEKIDYKINLDDIYESKKKAKLITSNTLNRYLYFLELFKNYKNKYDLSLECYELYWNYMFNNIDKYMFENVLDFLIFLKSINIKLHLCTNFTMIHQVKKCKYLNILSLFDNIVSSDYSNSEKPKKTIYDLATEKFDNKKVCMIGDREEEDINGAILNNIFAFHFKQNIIFNIKENCIEFGNYKTIKEFFQTYIESLNRVIYYSHRIGERLDLTQGAGGNISVKFEFENYKFLIIKSSGYLLSNITIFEGITLLYLQNNTYVKLWGNNPSIETIVHSTLSLDLVIHCHPTISIINGLTNFDIDYTEPGIELSNKLINYKTKDYIVLQNHGIIYQTNDINISLNDFEYKIYNNLNSKYKVCNDISDKIGGITTLFEHSKEFINILNRYGECILNMVFTPDYALFCNKIIKIIDINNIYKDNITMIYLFNNELYCNAPTLYKCKQIDELLIQYISILNFVKDINNAKCLTQSEINIIREREDEKNRLNK